jgi:hypothetical protein
MSPLSAYFSGLRRSSGAVAVWAGAWLVSLALTLPLAIVLRGMIAAHLGDSLAAEAAAAGVNWDWWQEFSQQASGLGTTFGPSVLGFASVLRHTSDLLDNEDLAPVLAGAVGAWLVVWSFLSGGILDRYARNRPTRASGFFAACGTHFFRFLRLGAIALAVYVFFFAHVHGWLFDDLWRWATREMTVERNAFALRLVLYAVFGALLVLATLVFDYARIRIVVEDRRSALGALLAAWRFVRRRPIRTLALYGLNGLGFLALAAVYALVAPGATGPGFGMWIALAIGQAWILARVWVKLQFYASQVVFFQGELAHAEYTAAPLPEWPESPAAEALRGETPPPTAP